MSTIEKIEIKFREYVVKNFDLNDSMISLKFYHSFKTKEVAENIAKHLKLADREIYLASIIGLFHDFGRFEQIKQYKTFDDSKSIDHADYSVNILFDNNMITQFVDDLTEEEKKIVYSAIKNHNKYEIESGLGEREIFFSKIIRDADKIDIYRVMVESFKPLNTANVTEVDEVALKTFYDHKLLVNKSGCDFYYKLLNSLCWIYDINFKASYEMLYNLDYLKEYKYYVLLWSDFFVDASIIECFDYAINFVKEKALAQ